MSEAIETLRTRQKMNRSLKVSNCSAVELFDTFSVGFFFNQRRDALVSLAFPTLFYLSLSATFCYLPFCLLHLTFYLVKISAAIIAFNEEEKIAEAIKSVDFADEILVVDSESTDKTREIAESLGAKVLTQKWLGFSKQKQFAVENASNDWILSLDADERVSEELKAEIIALKNLPEETLAGGFRIPRLSFYLNRPIRHGGWYPDWQIRLFNRKYARWKDVLIHESVEVEGKIEKLKGDILHFTVENMAHHHRMIGERYAPLAARQMFESGKKTTKLKIYTAGSTAFLQTFILKGGILDGFAGFCIARFAAHHAFLKHLLLWEMQEETENGKWKVEN